MENVIKALKWYIANDDTNVGQDGNGYWEEGKLRAIEALIAFDPELEKDYLDEIVSLKSSQNYYGDE